MTVYIRCSRPWPTPGSAKSRPSKEMRLLLAYAREIVTPRPYRLADLAHAAGISISGVRVAYSDADIQQAAQLADGCHQRHVDGRCHLPCSPPSRRFLPASVTPLPDSRHPGEPARPIAARAGRDIARQPCARTIRSIHARREMLACPPTSNPCSRSARCPGTAKAPSWPTTPAAGPRPASSPGWTGNRSAPRSTSLPGINPEWPLATTSGSRAGSAIIRSDNGALLSLNKDSYTLISHGEMGEIVEAVLAQPNVKWETAGVLDGGRAVWCLALLDEPVELPGDDSPTLPYLAITNRHDGTAACALRATAVRIVCANTFRAAELEGERTGATFSFIHKSSWRSRIEEARRAVTGARTEIRRYSELAHELLGDTGHAKAAGAVRHRVHPHATPGPGHRPGGPQRRGSPPSATADLRVEDHRAGRRIRLMAWSRGPGSTSTTSVPPGPGRPGSTGP